MMFKTIGIVIGMAVTALLYIDVSSDNFRGKVKKEIQTIKSNGQTQPRLFSYKDLKGLPEPVQRYFKYALKDGQEHIRSVSLKQAGEFRTKEVNPWIPFEAEQHFATGSPSFVWHARLSPSPYIWIEARDMYYEGSGAMVGKLCSAIPLSSAAGKETDISSLVRFLTEAAWFPTALLPGKNIEWKAIDSNSARAAINDHGYSVSAIFTFGDRGEITKITTEDKYRNVNGRYKREHWTGHFKNYQAVSGIKIPTEVEVEWNLPDRDFKYAKVKVVEIQYDHL